jgi:hypothetical protein
MKLPQRFPFGSGQLTGLAILLTAPTAWASLESSFLAQVQVYSSPASLPTLAYEVPAGENFAYYTAREVGDLVTLAGSDRVIAGIGFEYYANYAQAGGIAFRMYDMAANGKPGELIYSNTADILAGGGVVDISFSYDAANVLPDQFFYTVQFAGVQQGQVAGFIVPDREASVGVADDHVWEKRGNAWLELTVTGPFRGRRLGVIKNGSLLQFAVKAEPFTTVSLEGAASLDGQWQNAGSVTTDEGGDAEFEIDAGSSEILFYRTKAD